MVRKVAKVKYAIFDEKGFPKGFYSKDIHGYDIPKEAIQITDEQWQEFISNQGRRKWDFKTNSVIEYNPEDELTLEAWKERKKQEIARERYKIETDGITIADGTAIATDRQSQSLLMGAAFFAKDNSNYKVNWKGRNKWVQIDANTILQVAQMVRKHVQACFDKEKQLNDMIDNCTTIEEVQAITWDSI